MNIIAKEMEWKHPAVGQLHDFSHFPSAKKISQNGE
jgi:hypothetical protein